MLTATCDRISFISVLAIPSVLVNIDQHTVNIMYLVNPEKCGCMTNVWLLSYSNVTTK